MNVTIMRQKSVICVSLGGMMTGLWLSCR
ncbi:hypothetical protein CPTSV76_063 [Enterobacteria phage SV76]|nr:hypothetical protein CPTSV76_063 [Enterobacteria phage SV76]